MQETHRTWHAASLQRDIDMLVFGDRGMPVVIFPTSMGSFRQNKDFHLVASARWFIENGLIRIYTPATIDSDSWYGKHLHPAERAGNYAAYERFLADEFLPAVLEETGHRKAVMAGCSFGAYHATNFAFRHPDRVGYLFNMGGSFDIKPQVDGHYDDNVYFNNPVDFLPGLEHPALHDMGIVLGTGDRDICKDANVRLSGILAGKGIRHWLDIRPDSDHDWPAWRGMFPHYLSLIRYN